MFVLEQILAVAVLVFVLYLFPIWVVASDQHVAYRRKIAWFIAIALFSWIAFLVFLLLPPQPQQPPHSE